MSLVESTNDGIIEDEREDYSSPNSTPTQILKPEEFSRWQCHTSLKQFAANLHTAAQTLFPNSTRSRYTEVHVLMLSWEDVDPKLPVDLEMDPLFDVFQNMYNFRTERWQIPNLRSHKRVNDRVTEFLGDENKEHLKIVYYAGHACLTRNRLLSWTNWRTDEYSNLPTVQWSGIQNLLEQSECDSLILLDCCASGTANTDTGHGVTEVIAACPYYSKANGVGDYSFTKALIIELREFKRTRKPFTTGQLHGCIYGRVAGRWPEDGSERHENGVERHPAPIFIQLTREKLRSRSIVLSRQPNVGEDREVNLRTLKAQTQSMCSSTQELHDHPNLSTACITEPAGSRNDFHNPVDDTSFDPYVLPVDHVPRIAISIRLHKNFQVGDLSTAYFRDWLLDMPTFAEEVRVEAGFNSFSSLLIVSIPLSLYNYLPPNPAMISLGPITSANILAPERHHSGSLELNETRNNKNTVNRGPPIADLPSPTSFGISLDTQDFHPKPTSHAVSSSSDPAPKMISDNSTNRRRSETLQIAISEANSDKLDSVMGSSESSEYESTASSVLRGEFENGRKYHSYHAGIYYLPNDEEEQERMDFQHAMIFNLLDKLFLAPFPDPKHIIDYGTGTGMWAIEVANAYPAADVIGIDLSPIQPEWVPPNVQFVIDDFSTPAPSLTESFDLVHCCLGNAFSDRNWEAYLKDAYRCLAPGGWFEIKDFDIAPMCDDGTLPQHSAIARWHGLLAEGASLGSINLRFSSAELKTQAENAGFVNVEINKYKIPIGTWARDKKLKLLGAYQREVLMMGLEAFSLAIFTRLLGWSKNKVDSFLEGVRQELKTSSYHWYWPFFVIYGQRPDKSFQTSRFFAQGKALNEPSTKRSAGDLRLLHQMRMFGNVGISNYDDPVDEALCI